MKQVKIRTLLKASDINLKEAAPLVGKEVEIIINELTGVKPERIWKSAGSVNLKGKLDNLNIRNLAYD
ncbi:MAG: hypothetical protein SFW35_04855 [Chitinophagales bacterium]|nr:hypothetical protein [Chitinophagales bacterium]